VRPEHVRLVEPDTAGSLPLAVRQVQDLGTSWLVTAGGDHTAAVRMRLPRELSAPRPDETVWLQLLGPHTCFYKDEELVA
jgi:glycerol transport system ATP-binding protein